MKTKTVLVVNTFAIMAAALAGCGDKPDVSFNTLEDARQQARPNAEYNALAYRSENPRLQCMNIVTHGNSTQEPSCPQGDDWASLSNMNVDKVAKTVEKYEIKMFHS